MPATRLRRLGLCLHAELFEVQVSLDAAQDVVADFAAIPQIDDRAALDLDHRVANGADARSTTATRSPRTSSISRRAHLTMPRISQAIHVAAVGGVSVQG